MKKRIVAALKPREQDHGGQATAKASPPPAYSHLKQKKIRGIVTVLT